MNVFDNVQGTAHSVAESSLLKATITGPIYSLKCHQDLDNGDIVARGSYVGNQVFNSKEFAAGDVPLLVLTPPFGYNTDRKNSQAEKYFYNAKNEIARAYPLNQGDIWTVSEDKFTGSPAVGKYIDATYTISDVAGATGMVGLIVDKVIYSNSVSYRIYLQATGAKM